MTTMRNSVNLVGRPGSDPVLRNYSSDQKVATFSLAVDEPRLNANNERVYNTQWFNIVAWGNNADRVAKCVHKGKKLAVSGSIRTKEWNDDKGTKHYGVEIILNDFLILEWPDKEAQPMEAEAELEHETC